MKTKNSGVLSIMQNASSIVKMTALDKRMTIDLG